MLIPHAISFCKDKAKTQVHTEKEPFFMFISQNQKVRRSCFLSLVVVYQSHPSSSVFSI